MLAFRRELKIARRTSVKCTVRDPRFTPPHAHQYPRLPWQSDRIETHSNPRQLTPRPARIGLPRPIPRFPSLDLLRQPVLIDWLAAFLK